MFDEQWPEVDESLAAAGTAEIAVQVNGKLRGTIVTAPGASKEQVEMLALALEGVKKALDGKKPKKVIYVQDRVFNIVV